MLQSLSLENFRGFRSLHIDDLKRINLFVGKNNCGKTSILEAIEILLLGPDPSAIIHGSTRRGEVFLPKEQEKIGKKIDISHLFYGHIVKDFDTFFELRGKEEAVTQQLKCEVIAAETDSGNTEALFDMDDELAPILALVLTHSSYDKPIQLPISSLGGLSTDSLRRVPVSGFEKSRPVHFVRTEAIDQFEMAELWDAIALTNEEEQVLKILQILEPDIERIAFLSGRVPRFLNSSAGIFLKMKGIDARIPLGSLGDGIRHLLSIGLALMRAQNGVVLIDEIDTGLHHSLMTRMWEVLIETARRLDVQVFATTHSLDCLRSMAWLYEKKPDIADEVRLHRVEKDFETTVVYPPEEISIAARQFMELRG